MNDDEREARHEMIRGFVTAVTPAMTNETAAWNLWNLIASDRGPIKLALETIWHEDDRPEAQAQAITREALRLSLGPTLDMIQTDAVAGPLNREHWLDRLIVAVERAGAVNADTIRADTISAFIEEYRMSPQLWMPGIVEMLTARAGEYRQATN